jgi:hypothetical protein
MAARAALEADKNAANTARIDYILSGKELADQFGDPLKNTRTPDLIVQPLTGTIYTGSKAKVAEHGGFSEPDTHVALLVVNGTDNSNAGHANGHGVSARVTTTQIAPTILEFLGLDANQLDAVRMEGTKSLPGSHD